jgi:hypothetical protein
LAGNFSWLVNDKVKNQSIVPVSCYHFFVWGGVKMGIYGGLTRKKKKGPL